MDLKLSETTAARRRILVYLVLATDGSTEATGITVAAGDIKISKAGGARADHAGNWVEIGLGSYYYEFTAGELDTLGYIEFRIAQVTIRSFVKEVQVVGYDPFSATLGLILVTAANVWDYLTASIITVSSIGKLITDNLNATISSRSTYAGTDTPGTTTLLGRIASALTITGGKVDVNDKTGFSLSASGIQAIWDALTSALTTAGSIGKYIVDNITTLLGYSATLTVIQAKTDQLTFTSPNKVDSTAAAISDKTGYSLSAAGVDAILDDVPSAELVAMPGSTGTLRQMVQYIFQYLRNRRTVSITTETLYKENGTTVLGTATVSDNGTTTTKGKMG